MSGFKLSLSAAPKKKQYGLIKPLKPVPAEFQEAEVEEPPKDFNTLIAEDGKRQKRQRDILLQQQKALEEDPTAFDYDGVFDAIKRQKDADDSLQNEAKEQQKKKPKYLPDIFKTAKQRKIEQDIILERKQRKEMEKEEGEFGDKLKFMTSAYKQKLIEEERWIVEEKKREEEEAKNDVSKHSDLTGFYSGLLSRNVAFGATLPPSNPENKDQESAPSKQTEMPNVDETSEPIPPKKEEEETVLMPKKKTVEEILEEQRAEAMEREKGKVERETLRKKLEEEKAERERAAREAAQAKEEEAKRLEIQKRNTEESVAAARARYLERKKSILMRQVENND